MHRVNEWTRRLNDSRHGLWLIGVASFAETLIVPIPIELVLVPYMLANRRRVWLIAASTTAGCLLGALVGYGFGALLFNSLGQWLIEAFNWQAPYQHFSAQFDAHGFWAIVSIGVTPVPFQIAMLVAGVAGYPLVLFVLASGIARGVRYFGLALLVVLFGQRALDLWQNHSKRVGVGLLVAIVLVYVALQYAPGSA
ncbi:VTT domain-containing protein [Salinisphaera sp. T31B1]|uniref:YqaA family protein n=1 Tax=Salinisphaera sp. T31B1 TaxID=727963 RepID=UPI003342DD52